MLKGGASRWEEHGGNSESQSTFLRTGQLLGVC